MEVFNEEQRTAEVHVIRDDDDDDDGITHSPPQGEQIGEAHSSGNLNLCRCCYSSYSDQTVAELKGVPSEDGTVTAFEEEAQESSRLFVSSAELASFAEAARLTRTIGASVIKREAAIVNRRLLSIQKRKAEAEAEEKVQASKRRKVKGGDQTAQDKQSNPTQVSPSQSSSGNEKGKRDGPASTSEEASIWNQVYRMQRMSMYLKNAQLAQQLLLQEMKECRAEVVAGGTYTGEL